MATMNVSLPDLMKAWVEAQIKDGQYANVSDFIRDLIRRDREYKEKQERLREAIQIGLDSGVSERTADEIWNDVKARHADGSS